MENYRVERLSQENILHLISLYDKVFRIRISEEYLQKKYNTLKFGASYIGFISFSSSGSPVAFYGVIPSVVQVDGKKMLAAQSADTMTHPDHQRQGLFVTLATKTYDLARAEGIQFIYGFPNEASFPGFKKMGWKFLPDPLQLFAVPVNGWIGTMLSKLRSPVNLNSILDALQIPASRLFDRDSSTGLVHDEDFIEYKQYNKTWCVDVAGSRLWIKVDRNLKVGMAVPSMNITSRQFLAMVRDLAWRLGCTKIFFITTKGSVLYDFLRTAAKSTPAFPVGFYDLANQQSSLLKMKFEYVDIDSF
jgi:hypothetical protein